MARGQSKKPRQAEKLLLVMLDGHEVSMEEVAKTLDGQIEVYRLSTYLWNLKSKGAEIKKNKQGRKVVSIQLVNTETMAEYVKSRGIVNVPVSTELKAEDLVVA